MIWLFLEQDEGEKNALEVFKKCWGQGGSCIVLWRNADMYSLSNKGNLEKYSALR